jgi:hypothetical protein
MNYSRPPRETGIPLVPDEAHRRERSITSLVRSALGVARCTGVPTPERAAAAERLIRATWENDVTASYLVRAATSPTSLANTAALTRSVIADFLSALGPQSAGQQLLERGLQLSFDRAATISLPSFVADLNSCAFVGESQPIPVRPFSITTPAPQLVPRKLALISTLTSEMVQSSHAERFVRDVMLRDCALGLDRFLFDSTAGDAVRPPGLRYNIPASTASNATDFHEAMIADIATLIAAVSQVGSNIVLVTAPARAIITRLRASGGDLPPILGSAAISAADMLAVCVDALASATDQVPEITSSYQTALHMDSSAGEIVSSPGTVAYPVSSTFQTDRVSLRLLFNADWVLRDSRGCAWLTTKW